MSLRLAIFDLDGTLVDSRQIIQGAMVRAFEDLDLTPPDYEQTRRVVGLGLFEACQTLAPADLPRSKLEQLVETYRGAFVKLRAEGAGFEPLYEGARESVERLANQGWLLAIATGKARRGIDAFFEQHQMREMFDTTWCADDGPGKPHPFMIEEAMKAVGAEPAQSLIIGDAVHDIRMGRNAGVHTLGVSWGFGEDHELEAVGAHEIHHSFETLNKSLDVFGGRLPA
ncbi:MAG: HAD-IA family hydrolase [Henriciella sp.]|nr:HAD-IA family hydrolase [Henriciella sp.]